MRRALDRLWRGGFKTAIIAGAVALLVAGTTVVAAVPLLKKRVYRENEGIYAAVQEGPLAVRTESTRLATRSVPPGKYAVTAKLYISNNYGLDPTSRTVTCQLVAGGDLDETKTDVVNQSDRPGFSSMSLQLAHRFDAHGTADLRCTAGDPTLGTVEARSISVTAIRARKLSEEGP